MSSSIPGTVLLSGIVGSTAYGLDHAGSDVDRIGTYAAPTEAFHGLHPPLGKQASYVTTAPDATYHEAGKLVHLLLKGNPTVTEILWLDRYEVRSGLGDELIGIRQKFLSAQAIRNAYLGYSTQQFRRLASRQDGSFSSDTRKRTAKHARHLWRLIQQGTDLNACGRLSVRLDAAQVALCREFGEKVAAGDLDIARAYLADAERHFDQDRSALPEQPGAAAAEGWLLKVRREFYQ